MDNWGKLQRSCIIRVVIVLVLLAIITYGALLLRFLMENFR